VIGGLRINMSLPKHNWATATLLQKSCVMTQHMEIVFSLIHKEQLPSASVLCTYTGCFTTSRDRALSIRYLYRQNKQLLTMPALRRDEIASNNRTVGCEISDLHGGEDSSRGSLDCDAV
jgi:hypothetical protein